MKFRHFALAAACALPLFASTVAVAGDYHGRNHGHKGKHFGHHQSHNVDFVVRPRIHRYAPPVYHAPRRTTVVYVSPPAPVAVPVPAYQAAPVTDTSYCREFQGQVLVGGLPQQSFGTACLQSDGSWKIQP